MKENKNTLYKQGQSLLVGDVGSDTFWLCEKFSGISLGTLFGARSVYF